MNSTFNARRKRTCGIGLFFVASLLLYLLGATPAFGRDATELVDTISSGNLRQVNALLDADPTIVNVRDERGDTPLIEAVISRRCDVVTTLLAHGADPTKRNDLGFSALDLAADESGEITKTLLAHGAPLDIYAAAAVGDIENVRALLNKDGTCVNRSIGHGVTPLCFAAHAGKVQAVKILLDAGASVGANEFGSPLHAASSAGSVECVEALAGRGAKVDARDAAGVSPLHVAAANGHLSVVSMLCRFGAAPNSTTNDGATPIEWAAAGGHIAVVRRLLDEAPSSEATGRAVLAAAIEGRESVVILLLDFGAPVNIKSAEGRSILHYAAAGGSSSYIIELIRHGADVEAADPHGRTPFHLAVASGNPVGALALISAGANIQARDQWGESPLDLAVSLVQSRIVDWRKMWGPTNEGQRTKDAILGLRTRSGD